MLEPNERIAEVLFGTILVLTFTGSLRVAEAGRDDLRTMPLDALGCNLAWGIIHGLLYLMGCLSDVGRAMRVSNAIAVVLLFLTGYAFGRIAAGCMCATRMTNRRSCSRRA